MKSGVALADVKAYQEADEVCHTLKDAAFWLGGGLSDFAREYSGLTVRAAVGWLLADDDPYLWEIQGLEETGWFFSAAGLSISEAQALLAPKDPIEFDSLRTLIALTGKALPI